MGDLLVFFGILAAALLTMAFQYMPFLRGQGAALAIAGPGTSLVIQVGDLDGGGESRWEVPGPAGGLVLAYTPDKGFHVESASCPDQICVRSGFISRAGQSIVCVPNEVVISLGSGTGEEGGGGLDGLLR